MVARIKRHVILLVLTGGLGIGCRIGYEEVDGPSGEDAGRDVSFEDRVVRDTRTSVDVGRDGASADARGDVSMSDVADVSTDMGSEGEPADVLPDRTSSTDVIDASGGMDARDADTREASAEAS